MKTRGTIEQRVKSLEAVIASLQRSNRDLIAREARWRAPREFRIAKTVAEPGEEEEDDPVYPDPGANVYPIIFIDGTFTEAAGVQTPTYHDRQDEPAHYVLDLDGGSYIAEGSKLVVVRMNNRWWTARALGTQILYGKCDADHDKGATGEIVLLNSDDDSPTGDANITGVRNVYADLLLGAKVHIALIAGTWMIIAGECNL
jgi:hypothetical protein